MTHPPPNLVAAIEKAAELRAAGFTWAGVAKELDRPLKTIEKWPTRWPDFWAARLAAARAELRSDDEKVQRDAARDLLTRAAPKVEAEPPKRSDLHRLADFLEGLSDDERRTLLGDEFPDDAPRPVLPPRLEAAATGPDEP